MCGKLVPWIPNDFRSMILDTLKLLPYSLKLLRTKTFVDFMVFEAPTKILSLKITYKLANPTDLYRMRFAMVH